MLSKFVFVLTFGLLFIYCWLCSLLLVHTVGFSIYIYTVGFAVHTHSWLFCSHLLFALLFTFTVSFAVRTYCVSLLFICYVWASDHIYWKKNFVAASRNHIRLNILCELSAS